MTAPPNIPYGDYMHKVIRFFNISHLFTATAFKAYDESYAGQEKLYSLYLAREEKHYPPIIVCDKDGFVNTRSATLSLAMEDESYEIRGYTGNLPKKVRDQILGVVSAHGVYLGDDDDEIDLSILLATSRTFYMPIPSLKRPEVIRDIEWRPFVDSLAAWNCTKDPRMHSAHKSHLMRGIQPKLNGHSIQCTNGGTGKSEFYSRVGKCIGKATPKSFLGFAKSPDEIYPGIIDGAEAAIGIDQIESGEWAIFRYLFNAMETGKDTVSAGAVEFTVKTKAPFAIMANPIGYYTNPAKSFAKVLEHVSKNPAIGRRFGTIIYGRNFKVIENKIGWQEMQKWDEALTFFRAVEEYAKPELNKICQDNAVWSWVNTEITGYAKMIEEITAPIPNDDEDVRTFFREHGSAGQSRVRATALSLSLVENLNRIALQEYSIDEILHGAEEHIPELTEMNLDSIRNIVYSLEEEKRVYARNFFDSAPKYLKCILSAVELQRRHGDGKQEFTLRSLKYTPPKDYEYLSKCIDRMLRKKKIDVWDQKCMDYFGFGFKRIVNDFEVTLYNLQECEYIEPIGNFSISPISPFLQPHTEVDSESDYTNVKQNPENTDEYYTNVNHEKNAGSVKQWRNRENGENGENGEESK